FEPVTKWNATVDDVTRFPDMIRQAFRVATTGCPGPVHLQFQGNEGQIDLESAELDILVESSFARVPPYRPAPDAGHVREVLAALASAERPVIVAGGGVRVSGAGDALVDLAEKLSIPVATSLNGKDSIPGSHPLAVGVVGTYSRESANRVVGEADLVFFVGTETGSMTTHFWQVPAPGVRAVQLDIDAEALGRNYPLEAAMLCDARTGLEALASAVDAPPPNSREAWTARARGVVAAWRAANAALLESDAVPMRPERICATLTQMLPEDAIVLADTGHAGMWMGGMFDLTHRRQSYIRSAGHLGWAFAAGLGAKCACPGRPVFTFTGDAGMWYHLGEIETAVRWNINAVTLVNNNSSGNQSKRGFDRAYGGEQTERARELWTFNHVDFARLAENMGALGIRVEKPADLAPAVTKALEAERPAVIDVVTDIEALAPLAYVNE
ncbi:MAG: thiamine pyrophosphate-binding protein, partial [Gammaproteobacteria bacterium]|nr:thiamine pyrophosphate-binding protein [Gammaproteobacteria bacterium]